MKNTYVDGLFYNEPRENAPDFVLGGASIIPEKFKEWIDNQEPVNGYIRIDFLKGKEGKAYAKLNTWKPEKKEITIEKDDNNDVHIMKDNEEVKPEDLPF